MPTSIAKVTDTETSRPNSRLRFSIASSAEAMIEPLNTAHR
jgi:hypothetical protein